MKDRNIRARICAVLFASLFSSITFADLSLVTDRTGLDWTDYIEWQSQFSGDPGGIPGSISILNTANISTHGLMSFNVAQNLFADSLIIQADNSHFTETNISGDDYLYYTWGTGFNSTNGFSFSNFGSDICGLGTEVTPRDLGYFQARIEAFDASDVSLGGVDWPDAADNLSSAFIGISSDTAINRVDITVLSTGSDGGQNTADFAMNRVDFKSCSPKLSCEGFAAPMANFPVKAKKNGVFPLKMKLFDADGFEQTDDLVAAPLVEVIFTATEEVDAVDVSSEVLGGGHGSDGNQFEFTEDDIWQFNLKSKNYSGPGTYAVTVISGDESAYVIDPLCVTSFIK